MPNFGESVVFFEKIGKPTKDSDIQPVTAIGVSTNSVHKLHCKIDIDALTRPLAWFLQRNDDDIVFWTGSCFRFV